MSAHIAAVGFITGFVLWFVADIVSILVEHRKGGGSGRNR